MKRLLLLLALILFAPSLSWAACEVQTGTAAYANGTNLGGDVCDTTGARKTTEQYDKGGESSLNGYTNVESHWANLPTGASTAMFAGDTAIKNNYGFVHSITCYSDAAATAGTIALLDSQAAGSGNTLWSFAVLAVAYNTPFEVLLDVPFSVGLYADFTTTADMQCMVKYR